MICLLRFASLQNQKYLSAVMSLKESFGKICFYFPVEELEFKINHDQTSTCRILSAVNRSHVLHTYLLFLL